MFIVNCGPKFLLYLFAVECIIDIKFIKPLLKTINDKIPMLQINDFHTNEVCLGKYYPKPYVFIPLNYMRWIQPYPYDALCKQNGKEFFQQILFGCVLMVNYKDAFQMDKIVYFYGSYYLPGFYYL